MKFNIINSLFKRSIDNAVNEALNEQREALGSSFIGGTGFSYGVTGEYNTGGALTLSSVFRSVNLISNGIATLQMKVYGIDKGGFKSELINDPLSNILGCEPNELQGRYVFFKQMEQYKLNWGNSYILISRDNRFNPIALNLESPDYVIPLMVGGVLKYHFTRLGKTFDNCDVIHIINYPVTDALGITTGISTIQFAGNSLAISSYAEKSAKEHFRNGANLPGVLNTIAPLNPKQRGDIIDGLRSTSSMDSLNPNGVAILPGAEFKFIPFGITPKDSQLIESRQWNISDIGRFFNVNPILLFDNSNVKLSNSENAQLDFLNTTLLSEIELIENEFTRKLILPSQRNSKEIRFDLGNLLRADSTSRAAYFESLTRIGVLSANDVAKELNLPFVKGGDIHTIPVNVMDIENIIYNNPANVMPVDNKLKMNTPKDKTNGK